MKHIITALVENKPGVLARIVGLVSGRGYNIEALNVGPTHDATASKMTMVVPGDAHVLQQVTLQLSKLVDVISVSDVTQRRHLERELVLVEVSTVKPGRAAIMELATLFEARIVGVQETTLTLEMSGDVVKVQDFLALLRPYEIRDLSRSGVITVARAEV